MNNAAEELPLAHEEEPRGRGRKRAGLPVVQAAESRAPAAVTPMEMLQIAVSQNADLAKIEKLMDLQERWEKNQARKAFDDAIAAAKKDIKPIRKSREVDFTSQKGRTHYRYEDLAEIANAIDPILSQHGLSYRFRTTSNLNEPVTVTCVLSHRLGHSEENTLSAGRDESGNKNSIQAIASTVTYLQRYTLKAALGLSASNDDDGKQADDTGPISDDQKTEIIELLKETGTDTAGFLKYIGAESVDAIPAAKFQSARNALVAKKNKQKKGGAQ